MLKVIENKEKQTEFPVLREYCSRFNNDFNGLIVLFLSEKQGVVVQQPKKVSVKYHNKLVEDWQPFNDTSIWRPISAEITG